MRTRPDLRLIVITDATLAAPRTLVDVVEAALQAGAPAIQLRMKAASARDMLDAAIDLRARTRRAGALLVINDRADVALAAAADGVHVGPDDVPVAALRATLPAGFLIGCSTDSPDAATLAERDGADYVGCGAVFGTTSKDVGGEAIGTDQLDRVARAVRIPVVGIGGIDTANVGQVAHTAAAGVAVIGAVMSASDPGRAVVELLDPFDRRR